MIVRMLRPRIKAVQRECEVRLVQMFDRMIAPRRPAVAEFEDSLSLIVSDAKREARKQVGLMEFRFQPNLVDRGRVSAQSGSISIRTRRMAAANCWAGPRRGHVNLPRGFARRLNPGRCGKGAHGRSRMAETLVCRTRAGRGTRIGIQRELPRVYLALASHSGSCKHGCGDQCSRQKFDLSHSISPLNTKSQQHLAGCSLALRALQIGEPQGR